MLESVTKVQIETIRDCNAKCLFCTWKKDGRPNLPSKMTNHVFDRIISQIKQFQSVETICPYGHNEPLLDPEIWIRINRLKTEFPDTKIELSTNGIGLCSWNIGYFTDLVDERWVSFHGATPDLYESNMGIQWAVGEKVRNFIYDRPRKRFEIFSVLVGYSKPQAVEFWQAFNNVHLNTFFPHSRAGNIESEHVTYTINPQSRSFSCWRFDMFVCYNAEGNIVPCSNDVYNRHVLGSHNSSIKEIVQRRKEFIELNQAGADTICRRCPDHA